MSDRPRYVDYQCPGCRKPLEKDQVCPVCGVPAIDSHSKIVCPRCKTENRINRTLCLECSLLFVDVNGDYLPVDRLGENIPYRNPAEVQAEVYKPKNTPTSQPRFLPDDMFRPHKPDTEPTTPMRILKFMAWFAIICTGIACLLNPLYLFIALPGAVLLAALLHVAADAALDLHLENLTEHLRG